MLKGIGKKKKNCVPGEVLRYYGIDFRNWGEQNDANLAIFT